MRKLLSVLTILTLLPATTFSAQTVEPGRLRGRVVDIAGMPIPKVQITIRSLAASFNVTSDEEGSFELEVPAGSYEVSSAKLPGFAATRRAGVIVESGKIMEVQVVPAVSSEGVLCSLFVRGEPIKKRKRRKRHQ